MSKIDIKLRTGPWRKYTSADPEHAAGVLVEKKRNSSTSRTVAQLALHFKSP